MSLHSHHCKPSTEITHTSNTKLNADPVTLRHLISTQTKGPKQLKIKV